MNKKETILKNKRALQGGAIGELESLILEEVRSNGINNTGVSVERLKKMGITISHDELEDLVLTYMSRYNKFNEIKNENNKIINSMK